MIKRQNVWFNFCCTWKGVECDSVWRNDIKKYYIFLKRYKIKQKYLNVWIKQVNNIIKIIFLVKEINQCIKNIFYLFLIVLTFANVSNVSKILSFKFEGCFQ